MLIKIYDSEDQYSISELANYYTECGNYIEGTYGKIVDTTQAEIILSKGVVSQPNDECEYKDWEKVEILTDSGFVLETFVNEVIEEAT